MMTSRGLTKKMIAQQARVCVAVTKRNSMLIIVKDLFTYLTVARKCFISDANNDVLEMGLNQVERLNLWNMFVRRSPPGKTNIVARIPNQVFYLCGSRGYAFSPDMQNLITSFLTYDELMTVARTSRLGNERIRLYFKKQAEIPKNDNTLTHV